MGNPARAVTNDLGMTISGGVNLSGLKGETPGKTTAITIWDRQLKAKSTSALGNHTNSRYKALALLANHAVKQGHSLLEVTTHSRDGGVVHELDFINIKYRVSNCNIYTKRTFS